MMFPLLSDSIGGHIATLSSTADFRTSSLPFTGAGSYVGIVGIEYVSIEHDAAVTIVEGDFTFAGWFERTNLTYSQNVYLLDGFDGSGSNLDGYALKFHNGVLKIRVWKGGVVSQINVGIGSSIHVNVRCVCNALSGVSRGFSGAWVWWQARLGGSPGH